MNSSDPVEAFLLDAECVRRWVVKALAVSRGRLAGWLARGLSAPGRTGGTRACRQAVGVSAVPVCVAYASRLGAGAATFSPTRLDPASARPSSLSGAALQGGTSYPSLNLCAGLLSKELGRLQMLQLVAEGLQQPAAPPTDGGGGGATGAAGAAAAELSEARRLVACARALSWLGGAARGLDRPAGRFSSEQVRGGGEVEVEVYAASHCSLCWWSSTPACCLVGWGGMAAPSNKIIITWHNVMKQAASSPESTRAPRLACRSGGRWRPSGARAPPPRASAASSWQTSVRSSHGQGVPEASLAYPPPSPDRLLAALLLAPAGSGSTAPAAAAAKPGGKAAVPAPAPAPATSLAAGLDARMALLAYYLADGGFLPHAEIVQGLG